MMYSNELYHYGVPGMKWGVRNYRDANGALTAAGRQHYGIGEQRRTYGGGNVAARSAVRPRQAVTVAAKPKKVATPEEIEARKQKTKKFLAIAGGVALASLAAYGAYKGYKGATKLRDSMREDVFKNINTDHKNINTLNSKFWNAKDRAEYHDRSVQRAKDMASSIRRRDAVAAKLAEKTGIRIDFGRKRSEVLAERAKANEYANFIRGAENRADINRQIHDARQNLRKVQADKDRYMNTARIGVSKRYEGLWEQRHDENIENAKKRLNELLARRVA